MRVLEPNGSQVQSGQELATDSILKATEVKMARASGAIVAMMAKLREMMTMTMMMTMVVVLIMIVMKMVTMMMVAVVGATVIMTMISTST